MKALDMSSKDFENTLQKICDFQEDTSKTELRLDNINSSNDRRKLYDFIQNLGMSAQSKSYFNSQNKFMTVKKTPLEKEYDPNKITTDFINFIIKYTEIPFPTSLPEHFDYFVDLLDPYYDVKRKLNVLYDDLRSMDEKGELLLQNIGKYKKALWKIKEEIKNHIQANSEFNEFCEMNTTTLPKITTESNVYTTSNTDKILLSIDVKSANFRVLKHFCPSLLSNYNEWTDFVETFLTTKTNKFNFLKESKPFRTILINEINTGIFNKFAIIFINDVIQMLSTSEFSQNLTIVSCQNDEVVYEVHNLDLLDITLLTNKINSVHNFMKIKLFKLKKISDKNNYYVCETLAEQFDSFKNVPRHHIAQVIKCYSGTNLTDLDFKYTNEHGNIVQSCEIN